MKFGLTHRLLTNALAALGLLSLLTSGQLDRVVTYALSVALILAVAIPERYQQSARLRTIGSAGSLVVLGAQTVRLALGGDVLTLAVEFAAALQILRVATRRGAAHDQQIILLALLHLVAGTVLGGGLAYGLCFVGFLVVAPGALVLSHLRREVEGNYRQGARDRTGLPVDVPRILRSRRVISRRFLAMTCSLAIPIFVLTALLFVAFPRVGLSLLLLNHSRSQRLVGFSDKVDLGGVGTLRTDPTIVMRVQLEGAPEPPPPRLALYLRGAMFDTYDGRSWSRTRTTYVPVESEYRTVWLGRPLRQRREPTYRIDLEPIDPPVVFLPPDASGFRVVEPRGRVMKPTARTTILAGKNGEYKYEVFGENGLRYEVFARRRAQGAALDEEGRAAHLTLPANVTPRMRALARDWAGDLTEPGELAKRIETRLRENYRYDLSAPSGGKENPLDHFLFESKRGHCEYYSTAMAILLRTLGVPTRNVTGFVGGTFNRFGNFYAVRQGDAHSWVEVQVPGRGWRRFDPTPPSSANPTSEVRGVLAFFRDVVEAASQRWDRHVVGYDLDQQLSLLRAIADRYNGRAESSGGARWGSPRRWALGAAVGVLLAGAWWWRRQRNRQGPARRREPANLNAAQATALYQRLEDVLARRGVPRPAGIPPLAHARALAAREPEVGDPVIALTEAYLAYRFGGERLTREKSESFLRGVANLEPSAAERHRAA